MHGSFVAMSSIKLIKLKAQNPALEIFKELHYNEKKWRKFKYIKNAGLKVEWDYCTQKLGFAQRT